MERNRILLEMGFANYGAYLASGLWWGIRAAVMARDNRTCRLCLHSTATQVHHIEYDLPTLSGQANENMIAICRTCHVKVEYDKHPVFPRKHSFAVTRGNTRGWLRRNAMRLEASQGKKRKGTTC